MRFFFSAMQRSSSCRINAAVWILRHPSLGCILLYKVTVYACASQCQRAKRCLPRQEFIVASVNTAARGGRCNGEDVVDVRCRSQIKAVITTNDPLLLQMWRITWRTWESAWGGEGLHGGLFSFSNRKKKKENTSLYVRLHPRHSQVTPELHS